MSLTAVPNTPAITLLPTGPGGPQSLNPVWSQCDPANGNYFTATGRDLVTFYLFAAEEFAPAWLTTSNYNIGSVVNFGGEIDTITNVVILTNVLTITANNTFTVGAQVNLIGLTTATFLNGVTVTITSSTGTTFTATFSHADYVSAADTGTATNPSGIFIALAQSGPGIAGAKQPNTPAYWIAYVDADAELYVASAPDACTGRTSNIGSLLTVATTATGLVSDGYTVPTPMTQPYPSTSATVTVEFLVLPSSVFTQASGQVQFQASSNLIYVYVRSL